MSKLSRRNFLSTSALGAGAFALSSKSYAKPNGLARTTPLDGVDRENIKITDVKLTMLSYEFKEEEQWYTAGRVAWKADTGILQIFTDQGIIGIGEGSPYGDLEKMQEYTEKVIKPSLVGQNPFDVMLLAGGASNPWGGRGSDAYYTNSTLACAWAGADCALWDIIGKAKNVPVYKLLATDNEPETHIMLYASGGVEYTWYDSGRLNLPELIATYKARGYKSAKFRVGTSWEKAGMTVKKYITWLEKLRDAVGPDFLLNQEHNMRLTYEQCLEILPTYDRLDFHWLEEPFNRYEEGAVEGHAELCRRLKKTMVSGGEGMDNRFEFKEFIDRDGYDIVQPDCNVTGITEAWFIARMAHLKGKPCCPHNWHGGMTTMANAHFVAGIPNRHMLEYNQTYNPFHLDLFVEPMVPKNGYLDLSDRPGFGMELKPLKDLQKKYPYLPGGWARPNPIDL